MLAKTEELISDMTKILMNAPRGGGIIKEVYRWLRNRGYRVTSQVKFGHYRMDLEGANSRLGRECGGDKCIMHIITLHHLPVKLGGTRLTLRAQLRRMTLDLPVGNG